MVIKCRACGEVKNERLEHYIGKKLVCVKCYAALRVDAMPMPDIPRTKKGVTKSLDEIERRIDEIEAKIKGEGGLSS